LRAEANEHDLDARIQQAEQRLIAREENLRRRASALGQRVADAWQPRKLVAPLLVVGGVTTLGWLWQRRPAAPAHAAPAAPRAAAQHDAGAGGGGGTWVHLLPLLWPLLPLAWRAQVPPSVHKMAVRMGVPLMELLLKRRRHGSAATPAAR
jgi:hypothetical protein